MINDRVEDLEEGDLAAAQRIMAELARRGYSPADLTAFLNAWKLVEERLKRWQGDILGAYLITVHPDYVLTAISHGREGHAPFLRYLRRRYRDADWWRDDLMDPPGMVGA